LNGVYKRGFACGWWLYALVCENIELQRIYTALYILKRLTISYWDVEEMELPH
jgi:hypothetical protein